MKDLVAAGFDEKQINQIIKINDMGFDCSKYLNPFVSVEQLRKLKELLFKDPNYSKAQRKLICKFFIVKNFDITKYYDVGIKYQNIINLLFTFEEDGYDVEQFLNKDINFDQLKLIKKYLDEYNINIKPYLDKGYNNEEIQLIISLKDKKYTYEKLKDEGFSIYQIRLINKSLNEGYDIYPYLNEKYVSKQIEGIIYGLKHNIEMDKILNKNYKGSVMKVITDGLLKGYDITAYLTEESTKEYAEAILKAVSNNLDASYYSKVNDIKKYKFIFDFLKNGIDISELDFNEYDTKQLAIILEAYKAEESNKKISVKKLLNKDFLPSQISLMLSLMQRGKDTTLYENNIFNERQLDELKRIPSEIDLSNLIDEHTTPMLIQSLVNCLQAGYKITK